MNIVPRRYSVWSVCAALVALFSLTQCFDPRNEFEEGVPVTVRFAISVPENPQREMRAAATPDDENMLYNIALFIFEGGNLNSKPTAVFVDKVNQVKSKEVEILTTTGKKKIVAITNLATDSHSTITGLKKEDFFNADGTSKINNINDLNSKVAEYNTGQETIFAEGDAASFLMVSDPNKEYTITNAATVVEIPVARLAAKIEFTLDSSMGNKFIPVGWRVVNLPRKAYLVERPFTTSNNNHDASGQDAVGDYFNTESYYNDATHKDEWHEWEGPGYGNEFAFYTFENRKNCQKEITPAEVDDEKDRYRLRAKRVKGTISGVPPGKSDIPYQTNGDFEYAPKYCTYVQIKGGYEDPDAATPVRANVVYTIPLGYYNHDANDYKVERNIYYKYTIKVVGVNDIIVEAERHAPGYADDERHPGTEGIASAGKPRWDFRLDAHYESRLVSFSRDKAFKDLNVRELYFVVTTPYGDYSITGEDLMTDETKRAHFLRLADWIRIRRNNMTLYGGKLYYNSGTQNVCCRYPSSKNNDRPLYDALGLWPSDIKEADLLKDIYQWCQVIENDKATPYGNTVAYYGRRDYRGNNYTIFSYSDHVDVKKDDCYATIYFDEYYYEKDPLTEKNVKWNTFVGKGPRTLSVYKKHGVSRDGKSISLSEPLFRAVQCPIQTVYDPNALHENPNLQVFGVESYNEPGFMDYTRILGKTNSTYERAIDNSWINFHGWQSWTLLLGLRDGTDPWWGWKPKNWAEYYTRNEWDLFPTLNKESGLNETLYGCLLRNRDLNRNGKIDEEEIRWYLPSIKQLMELGLGEDALPEESRLYNDKVKGPSREHYSFVSSSIERGTWGDPYALVYLWASQAFATNQNPLILGGSFKGYSHRCVRRLGNVTDGPTAPNGGALDLISEPFLSSTTNLLSIELKNVNPHLIRLGKAYVAQGELPTHRIHSEYNRPFHEFYVARRWVEYRGDESCAWYTEGSPEPLGHWRIPNLREFGYIITTFDVAESDPKYKIFWGNGTAPRIYDGIVFYTSTIADEGGNHMFLQHKKGYNWHIQSGTEGLDTRNIYVRCVKDKR